MKMSGSKSFTACLVAAAMAAMLVPAVPAAAAETGGTADGFTYTVLEDGSAVITGCTLKDEGTIAVPESLNGHDVTGIYYRAFHEFRNVTTLQLPKTLESVRFMAEHAETYSGFTGLNKLQEIEVDPENPYLAAVDGVLFSADKKRIIEHPSGRAYTSFAIPEGVEEIIPNCFDSSEKLESVTLPATYKMVHDNRLGFLRNLKEIVLDEGNSDYTLVNGVLFDRSKTILCAYPASFELSTYHIPEGVIEVAANALSAQSQLKRVFVPASVETIGGANFSACVKLESIEVANGNQRYLTDGGVLYTKDMSALMAYPAGRVADRFDIPSYVTTVENTAFNNAVIKELSVPASVTTIDIFSLYSRDIGTIYVSTKAQYDKIAGNDQYIVVPNPSLPDWGGTTVVYSPGMVGVIDGGTGKAPVLNESFKAKTEEGKATFTLTAKYKSSKTSMAAKPAKVSYAGEVRVDYYPLGKGRSVSFNTLRYNNQLYKITAVNRGVLRANKYVAAVALGSNVASVAAGAFQGCKNLKSLYMGAGLKSIGKSAFYRCPKLASVTVASTALKAGKVGSSSFKGTAKKAAFQVPKSKLKAYKKLFQKAGASAKASFKKA